MTVTPEDAFANVRQILASLYPDEASARVIVADSGLKESRIAFSDTAIHTWNSILREAERTNKIDDVLRVVLREYATNPTLQTTIESYRQQAKSEGSGPTSPDAPIPPVEGAKATQEHPVT